MIYKLRQADTGNNTKEIHRIQDPKRKLSL